MLPVFRQSWFITEPALRVVIAIASRDEHFSDERRKALEARDGQPLRNARKAYTRDSVAVIPVSGPLVRHADMFDEISGATSYGALRKDLQVALDDQSVRSIVLNINSPGGEVTGLAELADAIHAARAQKKVIAYVDGLACSAAYWLAAACEEVVIAKTGEAGSIGCMLAFLDDSKALEMNGLKEVRFISSQSPKKNPDPETDSGKEQYQRLVDDLAAVFVAGVAKGRGVTAEHVLDKFGQGAVFVGDRAVEAGLADRIGNFEAVLAELVSQSQEMRMNAKVIAALGLPEDATADQVHERVEALAKFQRDTLAAVGATSAEEARGKIAAATDAARDLVTARAEFAKASFRSVLEKGLAENRLSLGVIQKKIPTLISDEKVGAAMVAKFGALEKTTKEGVLDAACSVDISAVDLRVVSAFVDASGPRAADPVTEPERTDSADAKAMSDLDRELAASLGLGEDSVKEYGGVRSADDLKKSKKRAAARSKEG